MPEADLGVIKWTRTLLSEVLKVAPESVAARLLRAQAGLLLGDLGAARLPAPHPPRPKSPSTPYFAPFSSCIRASQTRILRNARDKDV